MHYASSHYIIPLQLSRGFSSKEKKKKRKERKRWRRGMKKVHHCIRESGEERETLNGPSSNPIASL